MLLVRLIRVEDLPRVNELLRQVGTKEFDPPAAELMFLFIKTGFSHPFVVETDDGLVVSFGLLSIIFNPKYGWHGYIDYVVTDEPYRCRGFGGILIEHLISSAKALGCHHVLLTTSDPCARCMYEKHGFAVRPDSTPMKIKP